MEIIDIETKSKLLKRQIKKHLKDLNCNEYEKIKNFIQSIDNEYSDAKENRELLENSLELSTQELSEKNKKLNQILRQNIAINEKLENSREHLSKIIDNLGEGLIVVDSNENIIMVNKKTSVLSNYSVKKLVGKKYNKYINFLDVSKNNSEKKDFIHDCIEKNEEYSVNRDIILSGNNNEIPVFATFTPMNDYYSDGKTVCIVVFRDATKEIELSNMKNEFLSIASHELRTPMTVIRGYTSLFIKGKFGEVTDKQKKYLEKINENTVNLIEMVNDMLDINKLEAGKMEFYLDDFNLKELVDKVTIDMQDLFVKKNILLTSGSINFNINSDFNKIKQVIINFLSNAYKFSKENTNVKIEMKLFEHNKIKISVIDEGDGIKKEDIKKLFKRFSQVGNHLNKTEKGTGLGLSLSKKIIEGLGGEIGVNSEYGLGSEFYFVLTNKKEEN